MTSRQHGQHEETARVHIAVAVGARVHDRRLRKRLHAIAICGDQSGR